MEWYWWTDAAGRNFTRNVDLQGYAVCFGAVLVHRKLQGKWRTTAWPLVAVLSFTEHTVAYRMAFTQVQAELSPRPASATAIELGLLRGQPEGCQGGLA